MADFTPVELSVQLIPQPTDSSCWAGSMAMVVSTRDSQSVTPDAIAQAAGGYRKEVENGVFPSAENSFPTDDAVAAGLDGRQR